MYKALYRKWRPKVFEDVLSQPHVTKTLQNELENRPHRSCLPVYRFTRNGQDDLRQNFCHGGQL